ncbi:MAG: hypothetical protein IJ514_01015 [Clostridia bacterium]|nr:hypothetical protein [Clostridia bacterium]
MIIVHERREPKSDEASPCVIGKTFKIIYTGDGFKLENYDPRAKVGTIVELDDSEARALIEYFKEFFPF